MDLKEGCSKCPKCNDTGYVLFSDKDGIEYAKECDCGYLERERYESKLRFASIPSAYKEVRLKNFTTKYYSQKNYDVAKEISEVVRFWFKNIEEMTEQGRGLYFWSNTKGSGKTMLAAAIANELIENKKEYVKFATSTDILDEIRSTYNRDSEESEAKLMNDIANVKYLVIDDFGTERVSEWVSERFYQIVNKRYVNKNVTIFTSNYDLLKIDYDDRITNRIRERSFLVHFPEESVREVKARQENDFRNFKERKIDFVALEKEAFEE